jgi:threonine aldolase
MPDRRKRAGHLVSKHRYLAAQMEAYLADGLWLELARHANAMAGRLASGLADSGLVPVWPVDANEIFVVLPQGVHARLQAAGATYYPWKSRNRPTPGADEHGAVLVRLVTSFATTEQEVAQFVTTVRAR